MVSYRTMVAEQQSSVTGLVVPGNPLPPQWNTLLHQHQPHLYSPSYIILIVKSSNTSISIASVSKCFVLCHIFVLSLRCCCIFSPPH